MPEADLPDAAAAASGTAAVEHAQALRCGALSVALPHGWARSAVDRVELTAVPAAPAWLVGAANVDGSIVPVVDLLAWCDPGQALDADARDARLLVGGHDGDRIALLFHGMPRQVRVRRQADPGADDRLAPFVIGCAEGEAATRLLDAPALTETLINELAMA